MINCSALYRLNFKTKHQTKQMKWIKLNSEPPVLLFTIRNLCTDECTCAQPSVWHFHVSTSVKIYLITVITPLFLVRGHWATNQIISSTVLNKPCDNINFNDWLHWPNASSFQISISFDSMSWLIRLLSYNVCIFKCNVTNRRSTELEREKQCMKIIISIAPLDVFISSKFA